MSIQYDFIIIGGGAGGLVVASVASQLGLSVALIEKEPTLGGDCLHYGCVPSKTLIHSANLAAKMRHASNYGLSDTDPKVDIHKINAHIASVVAHIQQHDSTERFQDYGCDVFIGYAHFTGKDEIRVDDQRLSGKHFVIATGSETFVPPIKGLDQTAFLTNRELFSLDQLPPRLAVFGGGAIGVEMAQAFSRLGSQVTILQRNRHILAREDTGASEALKQILLDEGIDIRTSTDINEVCETAEGKRIICADGEELLVDEILVASGRRPVVNNLGLGDAGVDYSQSGIKVDAKQRTTQPHIYACGDCCGPYAFTHMAEYQAGIIISNAIFKIPKKADYRVVPRVIYSDPELAQVGLTEDEARQQGIKYKIAQFPFNGIDRALTDAESAGFIKLLTCRGKIVGATLLGQQAGELIHEIVLAMQANIPARQIAATIHAYPTRAQIHRRVVNSTYTQKLYGPVSRFIVKWLHRIF
ncbi:MAG: FAD-dependent oxidoreductase [Gammaproteobacteria bacterium]|nr:FAD-dependent oxidoreductase [Gammaproteobacteria bacterium]